MANSKCISDQVPTLLAGGCPDWLAELELAQLRLRNFRQNKRDVLEFFSGHGNRHRACQTAGLDAARFNRLRGLQEDLHYLGGLEAAVDRVLEVRRRRLVWFTPPCSWWTYLASPNRKRSSENQCVPKCTSRSANSLALVAAALIQLCASSGLAAAMEQLSDSCLFFFGCVRKSLAFIQAYAVRTWRSAFSDEIPIPKPLVLKGTCKWLGCLFRNRFNRSFEQERASGHTELQATQQYPRALGEAVWLSEFIFAFIHAFVCFCQTKAPPEETSTSHHACVLFFNPFRNKLRRLLLSSVATIPHVSATQRYFHSDGLKKQPQKRTTTRLSVSQPDCLRRTQKTSGARTARFFAENGTESYIPPADQVGQKSAQLNLSRELSRRTKFQYLLQIRKVSK